MAPQAARAPLALAEAILPGSAGIPGADEATVANAEQAIASFHPKLLAAWRTAQGALSAAAVLSKGRPFYALSTADQQDLLARWEKNPVLKAPLNLVAMFYKLVHFDAPASAGRQTARLGKASLNVVKALEQPRWLHQVHRADTWEEGDVECDVVVVGSGAGGAVVGRELADRGYAVVFLEEGELHRRDAFDGSAVRAHQRFYRGAATVGNVFMPLFIGRMVGGSTAINGGTCFRTPPWVLERWCEDLGSDDFAPGSMGRHFDRVESILEVGPAKREHIGPIADVMSRGCDALGWTHFPIPRNAPDCDGSGFCDFGCPSDARKSAQLAYLPPALEKGAMLLTRARVERLILENGRAVGVEADAGNGKTVRVRGKAVVLAGGAIPTPLFLLQQGLANKSGEVGKNLTVHPSGGFSALFDEPIHGHRHIPQGYACDQFLREGILLMAAQPTWNIAGLLFPFTGRRLMDTLDRMDNIASFALLTTDTTKKGRVRRDVGGFPLVTYDVAPADVARMHQAMIRMGEMCFAAGAKRLYPVMMNAPRLESEADLAAFRKKPPAASDVTWLSYHPLGTCKMGRDPKSSVVGLDHEAHDVPGLFVVDGSTVPGPLGVNPQLTIMAMATRAAERIAARLG